MSKYNTEEERKVSKKEYNRRWREKHPEYHKNWKKENPDYFKEWNDEHPDYFDVWRKEHPDYFREWHKKNPEFSKEAYMRLKEKNPDEFKEKNRLRGIELRKTKRGRANSLLQAYRKQDKERNRDECTLTTDWIIKNIFSGQCCAHCGESDWHNLGCNRLNNSLPHTPDNVEPCCFHCNMVLAYKDREIDEFGRLI